MYKVVIEIDGGVSAEDLESLRKVAERAFANRAGVVANSGREPRRLVFQGGEEAYGCLEVGMFSLKEEEGFMPWIRAWRWIEDDPDECCDMLEVFARGGR